MKQPDLLPTLEGDRLTLRAADERDIPALVEMFQDPEVRAWWGEEDAASVRAHIEQDPSWVVVFDGNVVGWLQVNEERGESYPGVAFDIAMAERGRGYGSEALRLAISHFLARGHHRFTIDPAADNERAIRAYLAVGFRPVGTLRAYERAPDGSWRDGLLMDLLADEFVRQPGGRDTERARAAPGRPNIDS